MVGLIDCSLLPVQLLHDFCHFSDISFVARGSSSEAGDSNAVTMRERPSFAAESAFSFRRMPTWLGIQHNAMGFPCFVWTKYSVINFCTRSLPVLKPSIACRLDGESQKITFFNFERRIASIARNRHSAWYWIGSSRKLPEIQTIMWMLLYHWMNAISSENVGMQLQIYWHIVSHLPEHEGTRIVWFHENCWTIQQLFRCTCFARLQRIHCN